MWALDVIEMLENLELYQTLFEISDPRWSCPTVELRESATLEQIFQSWSPAKHALINLETFVLRLHFLKLIGPRVLGYNFLRHI
jgi:hypothetical protein